MTTATLLSGSGCRSVEGGVWKNSGDVIKSFYGHGFERRAVERREFVLRKFDSLMENGYDDILGKRKNKFRRQLKQRAFQLYGVDKQDTEQDIADLIEVLTSPHLAQAPQEIEQFSEMVAYIAQQSTQKNTRFRNVVATTSPE